MSNTISMDYAVIGGGSAGMSAFEHLTSHGADTVLINGGYYGTTCARVGCMPSKLLIAAAEAAQMLRRAPLFGIESPDKIRIDGKKVMQRLRSERDHFVSGVLGEIDGIDASHRFDSYASFVDPHTLKLESGETVKAKNIVIATGSTPVIPDSLKCAGERLITSDDVFYLDDLPDSVAVFGAGLIGMELGQALHRLGVRVAIFGNGHYMRYFRDPAIHETAASLFARELCFCPDAQVSNLSVCDEGVSVDFTDFNAKRRRESFEYVLCAIGRRPNLHRLKLENSQLELNDRGVPLFDPQTMRCGQSHIFIAGDADGRRILLHEAIHEGVIAARNMLSYPNVEAVSRHAPLEVIFTSPQGAVVGTPYNQLDADDTIMAVRSFKDQPRSRIIGENHGLMHIYARKSDRRMLGAEIIAPAAEHLAHLLAWAVERELTVDDVLNLPFYHPVIEESILYAFEDIKPLGPAAAE